MNRLKPCNSLSRLPYRYTRDDLQKYERIYGIRGRNNLTLDGLCSLLRDKSSMGASNLYKLRDFLNGMMPLDRYRLYIKDILFVEDVIITSPVLYRLVMPIPTYMHIFGRNASHNKGFGLTSENAYHVTQDTVALNNLRSITQRYMEILGTNKTDPSTIALRLSKERPFATAELLTRIMITSCVFFHHTNFRKLSTIYTDDIMNSILQQAISKHISWRNYKTSAMSFHHKLVAYIQSNGGNYQDVQFDDVKRAEDVNVLFQQHTPTPSPVEVITVQDGYKHGDISNSTPSVRDSPGVVQLNNLHGSKPSEDFDLLLEQHNPTPSPLLFDDLDPELLDDVPFDMSGNDELMTLVGMLAPSPPSSYNTNEQSKK